MTENNSGGVLGHFLDLVYPRRCALCDGILEKQEKMVCRTCARNIRFLKQPLCFRCGRPLSDERKEYCPTCMKYRFQYDEGFAPFAYAGEVRNSIIRLKYGHRAEYAEFYAKAVAHFGKRQLEKWNPQLLVPVPVHRSRQIRRGYNQAALIAEALSRETGIPWAENFVIRKQHTKPQKELDIGGRRANLQHAFGLNKKLLQDAGFMRKFFRVRCAVVLDDIYTTGSTVNAVAALLKQSGVQKVCFAAASIATGI